MESCPVPSVNLLRVWTLDGGLVAHSDGLKEVFHILAGRRLAHRPAAFVGG